MALVRNLVAGLRLFAFLPVEPRHFVPSARQAVLLAALALFVWIGLDRLRVESGAEIDWFSVHEVVAAGALATALLVLIAPRHSDATTRWATAVASALPFLAMLAALLTRTSEPEWWVHPVLVMSFVVLYRAYRVAVPTWRVAAASRAAILVAAAMWLYGTILYGEVAFWFAPQSEEITHEIEAQSGDVERELFRQPDLVDAALAQVAPGTSGVTETFFLGFAGYGKQRVFDKEVRFARDALAARVDLDGHAVALINVPEPDAQTPLATVSSLRRALAGIAQRMNLDEDVLVLLLTSHGGADAELSVEQGALPLRGLRGADLRQALDDAGIRWRIVVISACHSASFIPHLEDPQTLVATASRADRKSLGCSDERELTYFGEALFRDALPETEDWLGALARAREVVERHEREEKVDESERSEPQVFVGARMREKLAELKFRRG